MATMGDPAGSGLPGHRKEVRLRPNVQSTFRTAVDAGMSKMRSEFTFLINNPLRLAVAKSGVCLRA